MPRYLTATIALFAAAPALAQISPADQAALDHARARGELIEAKAQMCVDKPFNTVTLPPATPDGPIPVYFLTPQTEMKVIPLGAHYLFEVDVAGKAGPIRRFTNTCIALPTDTESPDGKSLEALFITHLLDPVPTEIHFFSAMAARRPIYVGIRKQVWAVTPAASGPTARLVERD